jgi:hypothetical protein
LKGLSSAIPHVFCKCAEAEERKRVAAFFDVAVCDKCSEAVEKKEDELRGSARRERKNGTEMRRRLPHPRAFCMNIKRKEIWDEGFV